MPQISKIRVVNFYYNDGNRFIPDELYDLSSGDANVAMNSLFNLSNGGGKTVLVQLIMQPIHPRAKAGGRKIEDYFVRPGDHSFVVLEWNTDGSREKLLTGIAIAASSSNSMDDNQRGNQIKYYTFKTTYEGYSPYSIDKLELSSNENGKYVAASFDYMRERAKNSKGVVEYYSSDDSVKWTDMLSEYGIHRIEWEKVIEELNKDEGGLSQYFDKAKTSDKLISEFFIPAIERKLMSDVAKGSDSSLETMLINYARKITEKESVIKQRDTNLGLLTNLKEISELSDALYNTNEEFVSNVGKACGFKAAITERNAVIDAETRKNNDEIEKLNEQIIHIELEEKSKKYYETKEIFDKAKISYESAREILKINQESLAKVKHTEDILQCSKLYDQVQKSTGSITEIKKLIEEKENHSKDAEHIANLKYSVFVKSQSRKKELQEKAEDIKCKIEKQTEDIKSCEESRRKAEEEYSAAKEHHIRIGSEVKALKSNTDKRMERLKIDVGRRLDGFYPEAEIIAIRDRKIQARSKYEKDARELESIIKKVEKRRSAIPEERADVKAKINETEAAVRYAEGELETYESLYERLIKVCEKYSMDVSSIFTDAVRNTLKSEIERTEADIAKAKHDKRVLEEKKKAALGGYLHILPEIKKYVDSTGISCTSGEEYICANIEDGKIEKSKADEILSNYPQIAYSLLFNTDKDVTKLLSAGNIDWLPAVVPLFTMEQVGRMLSGEMSSEAFLSACDKSFFDDREGYVGRLSEEISSNDEKMKRLQEHLQDAKEEQMIADSFAYSNTWKAEQESRILHLENEINVLSDLYKGLEEEYKNLGTEMTEKSEELKCCAQRINEIDKWIELYDELRQMLSEEQDLFEKQQNAYIDCQKKEIVYKEICVKVEESAKTLQSLQNMRDEVSRNIEENNKVLSSVDDAKEALLVEDDLEVLYSKYNTLLKNMNEELRGLQYNLEAEQTIKLNAEKEITTYDCNETEYKEIAFSTEKLARVKNERTRCEEKVKSSQSGTEKEHEVYIKAEGKYTHAQEALSEYGGVPLLPGEIGDSFKTRILKAKEESRSFSSRNTEFSNEKRSLERISDQVDLALEDIRTDANPETIFLQENPSNQWHFIKDSLVRLKKDYLDKKDKLTGHIRDTVSEYKEITLPEIIGQLDSVKDMLDESGLKGDRLFTVSQSISTMVDSVEKINSKIETDLREIQNDFNDVVDQCFLQGKRMYTDLLMIANSSKAHLYEGKPQTQMVKMGLPEEKEISEEASRISIKNEIEKGANELRELMKGGSEEKQILNRAKIIVGSERLLHRYILKESIPVKVYKIDMNSANSSYKRWEDTLTQSSGAEKFVVFFAVVLTLMNYTRSTSGLINKNAKSVLVLDNPFGKITSEHLLRPMFDIARHFNVQLICFTDINKSDVVSCFECVIKLVIKTQNLSNFEIMTHEGNERIEHGYYKIMNGQMSLF